MNNPASRRSFLQNVGFGSLGAIAAGGWLNAATGEDKPDAKILGEAGVKSAERSKAVSYPELR